MQTDALLADGIKINCDISDARYWGYFSICGLLMRYRDLYRSEKGLKPWTNISREAIAAWIARKESQWPDLEQKELTDLVIEGKAFHPYDVAGINQRLEPQGLLYGAGYGMYLKPTFFLAELKSIRTISGLTVYTAGRELIRDLLTAPAMLQERSIFLRLEPLLVLLHYKFSELNDKKNAALEEAFSHYGFRNRQLMDDIFEKRLEGLTARYAEILLCHEVAEFKEEVPEWKDILSASGDRKNEHYLRALKDLIADTSSHGPLKRIIETKDRGALGLTVALMEGFQRVLFPEMRETYAGFLRNGDWGVIEETRTAGNARFLSERERVVQIYRSSGGQVFAARLKEALQV